MVVIVTRICRGVSCHQGRQSCAHPEFCSAVDDQGFDEDTSNAIERVLVAIVLMVSVAAVVGFIAGVLT